jgi:hypothetical protein
MPVREVAFELECFEWADERLEVAGRWQGLSGRHVARPVLTVTTGAARRKRLVALPGGHFGAAAESWRAAFAWPGDPGDITGAELEVGGNIVVELPLPDRKRRRRKRPPVDPGDEALRAEIGALHGQVERLRSELAARERENMQLQAEIEEGSDAEPDVAIGGSTVEIDQPELTAEVERLAQERDRVRADLSAEVERLAQDRDRLRAERSAEVERLAGERDRVRAERAAEVERLTAERTQLAADIERLQGESEHWKTELDALREAFSDVASEAEETRDRHRAELAAVEQELRARRRSSDLPGSAIACAPSAGPWRSCRPSSTPGRSRPRR